LRKIYDIVAAVIAAEQKVLGRDIEGCAPSTGIIGDPVEALEKATVVPAGSVDTFSRSNV
jgi:hypothetical protein